MPKPLPRTIKELRVPNADYAYFAGCEKQRFRPDASSCDLVNAWWLAEISFLSYVPDKLFVQDRLRRAGFEGVTFIERGGTNALIAFDDHVAVLAFRGTDITDRRNWLTDLTVQRVTWPGPGHVHRGFRDALEIVWPQIDATLDELAGGRTLWCTGHSLGGALATLATPRRAGIAGTYTFGAPRVGSKSFRDAFPLTRCHRFVNEHDLVTELPLPLGYRHVGTVHHLRRDGRIEDGTGPWERIKDNVKERIPLVFKDAKDPKQLWDNLVQENALSDHAPINYTIRLWNLIELA